MGRTAGTPKTGGREAGTPNKITGTLKEFVANLVDDNREQIVKDLKALKPKERLAVLERMMQYVLPKQQAVSAEMDIEGLHTNLTIRMVGDPNYKFPSSEDEIDLVKDGIDLRNK
jgi:hypothetical protein